MGCNESSLIIETPRGGFQKSLESIYKIVFVGERGVGKTSIIYRIK